MGGEEAFEWFAAAERECEGGRTRRRTLLARSALASSWKGERVQGLPLGAQDRHSAGLRFQAACALCTGSGVLGVARRAENGDLDCLRWLLWMLLPRCPRSLSLVRLRIRDFLWSTRCLPPRTPPPPSPLLRSGRALHCAAMFCRRVCECRSRVRLDSFLHPRRCSSVHLSVQPEFRGSCCSLDQPRFPPCRRIMRLSSLSRSSAAEEKV